MTPAELRQLYALTPSTPGDTLHAVTVLAPCTRREVAEAAGIKPATAYQRIWRARNYINHQERMKQSEKVL